MNTQPTSLTCPCCHSDDLQLAETSDDSPLSAQCIACKTSGPLAAWTRRQTLSGALQRLLTHLLLEHHWNAGAPAELPQKMAAETLSALEKLDPHCAQTARESMTTRPQLEAVA